MKISHSFQLIFPHYSPKIAWLASILLSACILFGAPARAANEYTVENVTVDATATDATDARARALMLGEQEAFHQLVARRNPEQAKSMARLSHNVISSMVRGYQVDEEKMASGHYHATVRYNFDPHAIQGLLGAATASMPATPPAHPAQGPAAAALPAAPVPSAAPAPAATHLPASTSKAVLVLPVYNDGSTLKLWQDDNKWRNIWFESALEAGGGLVITPQGDLDDRVDVDDTNVEAATAQSLARMYGRYGVSGIYVLDAFYNLKADPKPTLEVTLKRIAPDKVEVTHSNYIIRVNETFDQLLSRAANDIARLIYKLQSTDPGKLEYERLKELTARIDTSDMKEWEQIRKHLVVHGNIVDIKFTSIAYDQTTLVITYKGTMEMLGKTLVASGLRVLQDGDNFILGMP